MEDWIRHTYRRYDTRTTVKQGSATLKDNVEAEHVNPVPIAGFARPLPVTREIEVVPPAPDVIEVIVYIEEPDPFGLKG